MNIIEFKFVPRSYLHFDTPVSEKVAGLLVTNPDAVSRHPFLPFIRNWIVTQKIRKKPGGGVERKPPKKRPIDKAPHKDAAIFSYYSTLLSSRYEQALLAAGIGDCVTAFRSLKRRNIHFANEVFEFIKEHGPCSVITADVSDFFGNIGHSSLKAAWCRVLQVDRLPDDHYQVFKAVTRYSTVDEEELCKAFGLDPERPRADGRRRYCTAKAFREAVIGSGICRVNRTGKGIPQGSPISAVLANISMLEFDTIMHALVTKYHGLYRRYCDDLLLIFPTPEIRTKILTEMLERLAALGLTAHPEKTEEIDFTMRGNRLVASKPLNYLGFTFDGQYKRIRPASIARFYKKMRGGVGRAKAIRYRAYQRTGVWTSLRTKKLYRLYSYVGRRNFLSYAFDAFKVMQDKGIKKQVKPHWKRLKALIAE